MIAEQLLFYFFSATMLLTALWVVVARRPMNCAMALIAMFLCMSGLFILLDAYFAAIIQVLVYAGAVMVLFLFVVMLLDIAASKEPAVKWHHGLFGAGLAAILGIEFWLLLQKPAAITPDGVWHGSIKQVIIPLFTRFMLPFELVALILLVAMIGIVRLARREAP